MSNMLPGDTAAGEVLHFEDHYLEDTRTACSTDFSNTGFCCQQAPQILLSGS